MDKQNIVNALNIQVEFLYGYDYYQESLELATGIFVPLSQLANNQISFDDFLDCAELIVPSMNDYLELIEFQLERV